MSFQDVKNLIQKHIPNSYITIEDMTGTKDHLEIMVISDIFEGKTLIEQHRLLMDILKESLQDDIHAVKLKTLTRQKAQAQNISFS